jgi:hypothetical protein
MNSAIVRAFGSLALSLVALIAEPTAPPQATVQFVSLPGFEPPENTRPLPTHVILPDDVVTSSILFWRFPERAKPYALKFQYTEKGALKAQAFTQAHRGEDVRFQIGSFSIEVRSHDINTSGRDGIHGLSWRDMENIGTYLQPGRRIRSLMTALPASLLGRRRNRDIPFHDRAGAVGDTFPVPVKDEEADGIGRLLLVWTFVVTEHDPIPQARLFGAEIGRAPARSIGGGRSLSGGIQLLYRCDGEHGRDRIAQVHIDLHGPGRVSVRDRIELKDPFDLERSRVRSRILAASDEHRGPFADIYLGFV